MPNTPTDPLERLDALIGRWTTEGWTAEAPGVPSPKYFGSDGPAAYEARFGEDRGALVWAMTSPNDRFNGSFNDDRTVITGHWDVLRDDSTWQHWMDVTLSKQAS